jgi:hypothetical protein
VNRSAIILLPKCIKRTFSDGNQTDKRLSTGLKIHRQFQKTYSTCMFNGIVKCLISKFCELYILYNDWEHGVF